MSSYISTLERYDTTAAERAPSRAVVIKEPTTRGVVSAMPQSNRRQSIQDSAPLSQDRRHEVDQWKSDVDNIDVLHKQTQGLINSIFHLANLLQNGKTLRHVMGLYNKLMVISDPAIPKISIKGIILLSVQLNKLRALHLKMKIRALARSIKIFNQIITRTSDNIAETKAKIVEFNTKLEGVVDSIQNQFSRRLEAIKSSIEEYKSRKIRDVNRQILKFQNRNFMVLKEVMFSRDESNMLNLMGQRVLKVDHILNYNILNINQFFENVIILQRHLSVIFELEFPYLDELVDFLPDADFYNSIKVKENEIRGTPELDGDEEMNGKDTDNDNRADELTETNDKIVSTNNTIKLPLSSKSYNNQRRESMKRSPSREVETMVETRSTSRSLSPKSTPPSTMTTKSSTQHKPILQSQASKKKVIIPHRILKKPFSQLSLGDFVQLVYFISKLMFNFQVFFMAIGIGSSQVIKSCEFDKILQLLITLRPEDAFTNTTNHNGTGPSSLIGFEVIVDIVFTSLKQGVNRSGKSTKRKITSIPANYLQTLTLSEVMSHHDNQNQSHHPYDDWSLVSKILGSQNI